MNEDKFWELIARSREETDDTRDARFEFVKNNLVSLSESEVVDFARIFDVLACRAYRWDVWGAGYVIGGGCSDDGFMDFRSWLISMGRKVYENALLAPDSLAQIDLGASNREEVFFGDFSYVANCAYKCKTGKELPWNDVESPEEPTGEPWNENSTDELQHLYPKLWAKYGWI